MFLWQRLQDMNYALPKTDFSLDGRREISVHPNPTAQWAQAALQGITYILYKHYPFENLTLLSAWVLFCANCENLRQKTTNNLQNPWNQSPSNSEGATETIRKQEQFGFSLSLFLSTFPPCAHHHSSWLLLLQNTNLWGSRGRKTVGLFPKWITICWIKAADAVF